mmetsp:Transcript_43251/g.122517  ORF Transcript_43251/g.122517 Transcript_43251/m.122517 type:complete len:135 (+) Transcript_43251:669-1073(+)
MRWVPLKRRSDAGTGLRRYIAEVGHIEELRCDGAKELAEGNLLHAAAQFGIAKSFSVPHVHEQNGVAERMIQTLNNTATSMLATANLPGGFWPWAVQTAAYVRNRCPPLCGSMSEPRSSVPSATQRSSLAIIHR